MQLEVTARAGFSYWNKKFYVDTFGTVFLIFC